MPNGMYGGVRGERKSPLLEYHVMKSPRFRLVVVRMFTVGAIIDRPQTTANQKTGDQWSPLQTNLGKGIVFSTDLCYNGVTS